MPNWQPAECDEIRAFDAGTELIMVASGKKPSPCYEVEIIQLPIDIFPPAFEVRWRPKPGVFCPQIVVPYHVSQGFPWGAAAKEVTVYCQGGPRKVKVEPIITNAALGGGGDIPSPFAAASGEIPAPFKHRDEATGYSESFTFEEAFQDAIHKLPPEKPSGADLLTIVNVSAIGAEFGGIIGLNRMFVKVVRFTP